MPHLLAGAEGRKRIEAIIPTYGTDYRKPELAGSFNKLAAQGLGFNSKRMAKKQGKRIPRTAARRVQDMRDHLENLRAAKARMSSGERAAYKDVLTNLRTLLGKPDQSKQNEGLLLAIMEQYNVVLDSSVDPAPGCAYRRYLKHTCVLNSRTITMHEFVWELGSQDAAHSDEGLSPEYVMGEQVIIGGVPTNWRILDGIAEVTLGAGQVVSAKFRIVP